jgi:hypothetical protein
MPGEAADLYTRSPFKQSPFKHDGGTEDLQAQNQELRHQLALMEKKQQQAEHQIQRLNADLDAANARLESQAKTNTEMWKAVNQSKVDQLKARADGVPRNNLPSRDPEAQAGTPNLEGHTSGGHTLHTLHTQKIERQQQEFAQAHNRLLNELQSRHEYAISEMHAGTGISTSTIAVFLNMANSVNKSIRL